jgi:NTP pyrophosphatase (non-canonical NTP hydrolase)
MTRPSMQLALRRIEEARNDRWERLGPIDHDPEWWVTLLVREMGDVAHEVMRYRTEKGWGGKDVLQMLTRELAETAAVCVAMMEAIDAEYKKLDGPRIREFQQVTIEDGS